MATRKTCSVFLSLLFLVFSYTADANNDKTSVSKVCDSLVPFLDRDLSVIGKLVVIPYQLLSCLPEPAQSLFFLLDTTNFTLSDSNKIGLFSRDISFGAFEFEDVAANGFLRQVPYACPQDTPIVQPRPFYYLDVYDLAPLTQLGEQPALDVGSVLDSLDTLILDHLVITGIINQPPRMWMPKGCDSLADLSDFTIVDIKDTSSYFPLLSLKYAPYLANYMFSRFLNDTVQIIASFRSRKISCGWLMDYAWNYLDVNSIARIRTTSNIKYMQSHPSPINDVHFIDNEIRFRVDMPSKVSINLFSLNGSKSLESNKFVAPGLCRLRTYDHQSNQRTISSGIYLLRITISNVNKTEKLFLKIRVK